MAATKEGWCKGCCDTRNSYSGAYPDRIVDDIDAILSIPRPTLTGGDRFGFETLYKDRSILRLRS